MNETINIAFLSSVLPVRGQSVTLDVEGTPARCFLHRHGKGEVTLSHYGSGQKLTVLDSSMEKAPEAAQLWLNARLKDCGKLRVLAVMNEAKEINVCTPR